MPTAANPPIEAGGARPFLSAVILAAGASTRMGRPKQLLPLGDRVLLQRIVDEVAGSCADEIILVLGHAAAEIRRRITLPEVERPCRVVVNDDHERGQSGSLRLGLGAADPRAVAAVILLGDQPGVTCTLIDRVASAFLAAGVPAARPVYDGKDRGRIPGHPVFLGRALWRHVDALRGDAGARSLLAAHPEWLLEVPVEGAPPADLDTWQDYEAYRRSVPAGAPGADGRSSSVTGRTGEHIDGNEPLE
jgi:molybdenum cofactor cytidylyltransferase